MQALLPVSHRCLPVNPGAEGAGLIKAESRCQQGSLMQQEDQVLHSLVALVCICTLAQLLQEYKAAVSTWLWTDQKGL